jgi:uncharacterized protein (TIGR00661 family)
MKILYFYCGEGLGHATRTIAAYSVLKDGHEVVFASYGPSRDFGIKSGLNVEEVPPEMVLVGTNGALDLKTSIKNSIKYYSRHPRSIFKYNKLLKTHKPDLVISDSFFIPAMIAKEKKLPVWMVLNQTNVHRFFKETPGLSTRIVGKMISKFNNAVLSRMDKVLIPDFSWPYTLSKDNIDLTKSLSHKTIYLGPMVRKHSWEINSKPQKKKVFSSMGGFGYRRVLFDKLLNVAKALPNYSFDLVDTSTTDLKNVTLHERLVDPFTLMNKAEIIISGGGHSTLIESICLGKIVLSAPDFFHCEQEGNANGIERLGMGKRISYDTPAKELRKIIVNLSNSKKHKKNASFFKKLAKREDGREKFLKLVNEFEEELEEAKKTKKRK